MLEEREIVKIFLGILLLLAMHTVAIVIIYALGLVLDKIYSFDGYLALIIWTVGAGGFFIWQLLYVTPTCMFLYQQRRREIMNGVIVGAVLTALFNGGIFVFLLGR